MSRSRLSLKLDIFASFVDGLRSLSTCKRAQVGAIVVPPDLSEIYANGYNGPPRGLPNEACTHAEGDCGCIHAETNVVAKLGWHPGPLIMLCSTQPCWRCAGLIVNKKLITHVLYWRSYREGRGLTMLYDSGIKTLHYKDTDDATLERWWPTS